MNEEQALIPIEEKSVEFYGDPLVAVLVNDDAGKSQIYVPLKPISDALGLRWSGQYERVQRDEVLAEEAKLIRVTRIKTQRGNPTTIALPLEFLPGWLFGISASRVKPELRENIIRYRRECYRVLSEAFQQGTLTTPSDIEMLLDADSPAAQAYRMAQAVLQMARNQLLLESRLNQHDDRFETVEGRLETVEALLGHPERFISEAQAVQISQAVLAIAHELGKRSGRNEYQGVYSELYRRYEVTSYKRLPHNKFESAMEWMRGWYATITDLSNAPF